MSGSQREAVSAPDHNNSPGFWGRPAPSGNATLLMEENAIMGHNYSVSHSAITLMVFNIEHIRKLNGMGNTPKQYHQAAKNLFPPACRVTGLLLNGKLLVPSELIPRCSELSSCPQPPLPQLPSPRQLFPSHGCLCSAQLLQASHWSYHFWRYPLDHSLHCITRVNSHSITESLHCHSAKVLCSLALAGLPPSLCKSNYSEPLSPARFVHAFL